MKRVLSIDGGGIRGLIPALVLAELEKISKRPVTELFDLIAGTSTGGILALGLAKASPSGRAQYGASDLAALYQKRGREIFHRSFWKGVSSVGGLNDETYSAQGLEKVLLEYMGEARLADALVPTLITSYDIERRSPLFLKSWRPEYNDILMRDAARATSAAPTYFEPAKVQVGKQARALIDGGIFINSPAVSAYAEARRLFPDDPEVLVVSLGTGELERPIPFDQAKDWGKISWLVPLLGCMFDGMADAVDYQMRMLLGNNYSRFQTSLSLASDDMDNASAGNIENLKAEAKALIKSKKAELAALCERLSI